MENFLNYFKLNPILISRQISPIECAIEMMEQNNKTLRDLVIENQNDPNLVISQLTMKIQGVVDAAVNGN